MKRPMLLSICRCPKHPKFWSIGIDEKNGIGTRVTPSKCCGTWTTIMQWELSKDDWALIAELASNASRTVEQRWIGRGRHKVIRIREENRR